MLLGVLESYAFYSLYVMDEDWGSVGAYRVDADGTPAVTVWTCEDGGRCWLEVYRGEDSSFLRAARASSHGKTVGSDRATIRQQVFTGDLPKGWE